MSNELNILKRLVASPNEKTFIGKVVESDGGTITVLLSTGVRKSVYGTAPVGSTVLLKSGELRAVVKKEVVYQQRIP